MRALVLADVLAVLLQDVYLHGPPLGEACVADVAFVGPLTWDTDDNNDPPPRGFTPKPLVLPKGHLELKAFLPHSPPQDSLCNSFLICLTPN